MHETPTLRVPTGSGFDGEAVLGAAREVAEETTVLAVGPTGHDGLEPLVSTETADTRQVYASVTPDQVREIVAALETGETPDLPSLEVTDESDGTQLATGPLVAGDQRVLARAGWTPVGDTGALREGAAERAATDPDGALETVHETGLRGRGRGDAARDDPVAREWVLAGEGVEDLLSDVERTRTGDPVGDPVVVVNANESDPAVDGDRLLCESVPAEVLDGALAVARVVGAEDVVCYVNERDETGVERLEGVVDAADVPESVSVTVGPDRYIAGEPTMALESLEGADRLEARRRPPGPSEWGLYGRPTVVHTPRTLVQVRETLVADVDPGAADPGTRLVTVSGDVRARATVELPTDASLSRVLDAVDAEPHVAVVGGQFGGLTRSLAVPASAPALAAAGLGTNGAVELLDERRCAVATAGERTAFADEENCGRCVPCREGSTQLVSMLRAVYDGEYDGEALRELGRVVRDSSLCVFGQEAARPVLSAVERFESEFRAHADGRCPAGACEMGAGR